VGVCPDREALEVATIVKDFAITAFIGHELVSSRFFLRDPDFG
jgi:hypothetical protein